MRFDRLLLGSVTDFIDVGLPIVFNLADLALAVGCVLVTWARQRSSQANLGTLAILLPP